MATATQVSVEQYFRTSYEPDADYVDGRIEERPMGEYDHACWQRAIQKWFLLHEDSWNIRVLPELRIQVSATRYRVPDVVVVDHARPIEQVLTYPPIAVFEILSPQDSVTRTMGKLREYETLGVETITVVDPPSRTVYQFQNSGLRKVPSGLQQLGTGPCSIDWGVVAGYVD